MIIRGLNIIVAFLFLSLFTQAQEATAVLQDKQIKIGEQTTIQLELRTPADGKTVNFPTLIDTISGKIEIVKLSEMDTAYDENDISIRVLSQTITITSWDSGFHVVPPFTFLVDGKPVETEPDLLEVSTVPIEAEADIKDIKEIMDVPFSLWDWILVHKLHIGAVILLIVLLIVGFILYKRWKKEVPEEKVLVPKEEADVVAKRQLDELASAKLWQNGKVNDYYTGLSHILREYLENRFHLSALEKTTEEIELLIKYHKEIDERTQNQFVELLQLADMAKFAKQEPMASENEEALKYAYRFVEETKMVMQTEQEQEQEEEGVEKNRKQEDE